jgi:UPF0716 protein FxsA
MIAVPFPLIIAEFVIFWLAVQKFGFLTTLEIYFLPCLLGVLIMNFVGRAAILNFQGAATKGQMPGNKILHSVAIFISGILFLIPSFFSRIFAVILFLPGLRHFVLWRFKSYLARKISVGAGKAFSFGAGGPFSFGGGSSGFRYTDFRQQQGHYQDVNGHNEEVEMSDEREVSEAEVLDVTPLEVTHQGRTKKD